MEKSIKMKLILITSDLIKINWHQLTKIGTNTKEQSSLSSLLIWPLESKIIRTNSKTFKERKT